MLLIYDADRLGREQIETSYILKQLPGRRAHPRDERRRPGAVAGQPVDKMLAAVLAGAAEIERAKATERTRAALQRKAERGHVVGGCLFGYRNVPVVDASGRRSHVTREIVEAEAAVVRRIFELYANGAGFKTIAVQLNAEARRVRNRADTSNAGGRPRACAAS